ncbi:MAG: hypothetical protein AB7D57_07730 [Desulfovibrionaceae bacterium]
MGDGSGRWPRVRVYECIEDLFEHPGAAGRREDMEVYRAAGGVAFLAADGMVHAWFAPGYDMQRRCRVLGHEFGHHLGEADEAAADRYGEAAEFAACVVGLMERGTWAVRTRRPVCAGPEREEQR